MDWSVAKQILLASGVQVGAEADEVGVPVGLALVGCVRISLWAGKVTGVRRGDVNWTSVGWIGSGSMEGIESGLVNG
jgi:hypothetical protein